MKGGNEKIFVILFTFILFYSLNGQSYCETTSTHTIEGTSLASCTSSNQRDGWDYHFSLNDEDIMSFKI